MVNKCPECGFIGARRPWYPQILHALSTPIDFVASQLYLDPTLKQYGPYLVAVAQVTCPESYAVTMTR